MANWNKSWSFQIQFKRSSLLRVPHSIWFFSPSRQPDKYATWHNCPGKILFAHTVKKDGNWMTGITFSYFYVTRLSLPKHHEAVGRHWKSRFKMKTKVSWTAMKAERNAFSLPACIRLVFWSVNNTKQHILTKTADAIVPRVFMYSDAAQSIIQ